MGIQSFADPLGHQLISVLHFAPTKDLIQSKAAHGLLWCMARSLWPQLKRYGATHMNQIIRCSTNISSSSGSPAYYIWPTGPDKYFQLIWEPSSLFTWPIWPAKYLQMIWNPSSLITWSIGPPKYFQLIWKPSSLFTWPNGTAKYIQLIRKRPPHYVYIPLAVGELKWASLIYFVVAVGS